ncbi:hypothetical protein GQ457_06G002880 [Hibiscus cannabinus]
MDKTKFNDYGKGLANPCDDQQSQLQNPKDDELEELFARMNLNLNSNSNPNPIRNPRDIWSDFRAPTMGSLYDGFKGGYYLNSTRSPPSQNMVPRPSFSDTFARNRFLDSNIQRGTLSVPLSPWLYDQQNFYYPTRPRSDHSSTWLLRELRGRVCEFAKDQNGCRLLQTKLDDKILSGEEIEMLFMEVKDHLHELVVHRFANYLVQKLFRACNQELRTHLLLLLVCVPHRFLEICTDVHGSRTVQKFIDRITTREQRCILFSALRPIAVILAKNSNGHHIIQECLLKFSNRELRVMCIFVSDTYLDYYRNVIFIFILHVQLVMESFVDHCIYIATNQSGCFVVQQCLRHADPEMRGLLLGQIIANAILLSEDEYGNYVVQFVLEMKDDYLTARIIAELEGSFVTLSFSKYGSNVVEKCLKVSGEQLSAMIIREIMNDPDFVKVIGHDYGNYVAQSALSVSKVMILLPSFLASLYRSSLDST